MGHGDGSGTNRPGSQSQKAFDNGLNGGAVLNQQQQGFGMNFAAPNFMGSSCLPSNEQFFSSHTYQPQLAQPPQQPQQTPGFFQFVQTGPAHNSQLPNQNYLQQQHQQQPSMAMQSQQQDSHANAQMQSQQQQQQQMPMMFVLPQQQQQDGRSTNTNAGSYQGMMAFPGAFQQPQMQMQQFQQQQQQQNFVSNEPQQQQSQHLFGTFPQNQFTFQLPQRTSDSNNGSSGPSPSYMVFNQQPQTPSQLQSSGTAWPGQTNDSPVFASSSSISGAQSSPVINGQVQQSQLLSQFQSAAPQASGSNGTFSQLPFAGSTSRPSSTENQAEQTGNSSSASESRGADSKSSVRPSTNMSSSSLAARAHGALRHGQHQPDGGDKVRKSIPRSSGASLPDTHEQSSPTKFATHSFQGSLQPNLQNLLALKGDNLNLQVMRSPSLVSSALQSSAKQSGIEIGSLSSRISSLSQRAKLDLASSGAKEQQSVSHPTGASLRTHSPNNSNGSSSQESGNRTAVSDVNSSNNDSAVPGAATTSTSSTNVSSNGNRATSPSANLSSYFVQNQQQPQQSGISAQLHAIQSGQSNSSMQQLQQQPPQSETPYAQQQQYQFVPPQQQQMDMQHGTTMMMMTSNGPVQVFIPPGQNMQAMYGNGQQQQTPQQPQMISYPGGQFASYPMQSPQMFPTVNGPVYTFPAGMTGQVMGSGLDFEDKRARQRSSKFRGVSWHKRGKKWIARIWVDGKSEHLGVYADEVRAALAVDERLVELGEEQHSLNFANERKRKQLAELYRKGKRPTQEMIEAAADPDTQSATVSGSESNPGSSGSPTQGGNTASAGSSGASGSSGSGDEGRDCSGSVVEDDANGASIQSALSGEASPPVSTLKRRAETSPASLRKKSGNRDRAVVRRKSGEEEA